MELHSQYAAAKKVWTYLRLAFFMIRKSLVSNRKKLRMDVHFMLKRGLKPLWKNLQIILLKYYIPAIGRSGHDDQVGKREYEFSCSNSTPIPPYLRALLRPRRRRSIFSCIDAGGRLEAGDHEPTAVLVDISDFSSDEDEDEDEEEEEEEELREEINEKAEEFIRKFHQQLRSQGHIASAHINP